MYPYPAEFIVDVSQSGIKSVLQSVDPISKQAAELVWTGSFDNSTSAATVTITGVAPAGTNPGIYIITTAQGDLRTEKNFYRNATLTATGGATPVSRILSYEFINTSGGGDTGIVVLDSPIPLATGGTISNGASPTATANPSVFIPTAPDIENYYTGKIITNRTRAQTRTITSFWGSLSFAILDSPAATWVNTDDYSISEQIPSHGGYSTAIAPQFTAVSSRIFQLDPTASPNSNAYAGGFLRIDSVLAGGLPVAPFSVPAAPYNESRRIVRYIGLSTVFTAVSGSSFTLGTIAAGIESTFYVGAFITTSVATYQISTFDTTTKSGTITGAFGAEAVGDAVNMRSVIISSPFTVTPTTSTRYEVNCFDRDNSVPFNYTGTISANQQMSCYKIELLDLVLPNIDLTTGSGGRIAFYPYVYVELQNVAGANSNNSGIIISNNPHSTKMLFRVPIDDTPTPLISPFIKIDGDGAIQTVKFNPNDSLKFSVHLPNGDLFIVDQSEYFGPQKPNPLIQISAMFSIQKIG